MQEMTEQKMIVFRTRESQCGVQSRRAFGFRSRCDKLLHDLSKPNPAIKGQLRTNRLNFDL